MDVILSVDDDEEEEEEDDGNEEELDAAKEDQTDGLSVSVSAGVDQVRAISPLSEESKSQTPPVADTPSSSDSPSQSEPVPGDTRGPLSNGNAARSEDAGDSCCVMANGLTSPATTLEKCHSQTSISTSPLASPRATRSHKRKREDEASDSNKKTRLDIIYDDR